MKNTHMFYVQIPESGNENEAVRRYLREQYLLHYDYEAPPFFMEIPTWIPQLAGMLGESWSHNLRVPDSEEEWHDIYEEIHRLGEHHCAVAVSVTDSNFEAMLAFLGNIDINTVVVAGGYTSLENINELTDRSVIWLARIEDAVGVLGDCKLGPPDYRLFHAVQAIPRLQLSTGCLNNCRFCTVEREIRSLPLKKVIDQVESWRPLNFKYVYVDDKTFGQAGNWVDLDYVGRRVQEYNSSFVGFIVQTTATMVLNLGSHPIWNKWVKFVEVGVESVDDKWLRWMRKPHTLDQVELAIMKCAIDGVGFIANMMSCFPGQDYDAEMAWLERWRKYIAFVNPFRLTYYANSKGSDDWYCAGLGNSDETTFARTWLTLAEGLQAEAYERNITKLFKPKYWYIEGSDEKFVRLTDAQAWYEDNIGELHEDVYVLVPRRVIYQ